MKLQENLKNILELRNIDLNTYEQVHNLGAQNVQKAVCFVDSNVQKLDLSNLKYSELILIVLEGVSFELLLRFDQLEN